MANETNVEFKVVPMPDTPGRYIIIEAEGGVVLDDAQGYGYRSARNAYRAGWYKFKGGKAKDDAGKAWWKKHAEFAAELEEPMFLIEKQVTHGEIGRKAANELRKSAVRDMAKERGLDDYRDEYLSSLKF